MCWLSHFIESYFSLTWNFVDQTALDVFVAYKIHSESPVTTVLADMYGNLNLCHALKRKKML